jgi:hypothetical protein
MRSIRKVHSERRTPGHDGQHKEDEDTHPQGRYGADLAECRAFSVARSGLRLG